MKKRELLDLLDRVLTWPKEKQEAAFDSLSQIEIENVWQSDDVERIRELRGSTTRPGSTEAGRAA